MAVINQGVGICGDTLSNGGVGTGLAVDPMRGAARFSLSPVDHTSGAAGVNVNGQYRVRAATTAIAPNANVVLINFRFIALSPAVFAAILRVQVEAFVVTAVTAQRADPIVIQPALGGSYTASETTNIAGTNPTLTGNNPKLRTSHGASAFASAGQIVGASNAAGMTGGTSTLSGVIGEYPCSGPTGLIGIGTGTGLADIFRVETQAGEHPLILATNEGFQIKWGATTLGTGTIIVGAIITWAELFQY